MGLFKRVFKPIRKAVKKFIPKELKPFLPYIAAGFGPATAGLTFGTGLGSALAQRGLIAAATSAATDEQGNPLRAGFLAAAPGAIQGGLGQFGDAYGSTVGSAAGGDFSFLQKAGDMASKLSQNKTLQTLADPRGASSLTDKAIAYGTPASIDQSAKFAEIRQDEIDEYNRNLLEQGVASKVDRRKAIFGIYQNAGYEEDYINTMLDTYGYAGGGITTLKRGLVDQAGSYSGRRNIPGETEAMTKFYEGLDDKVSRGKNDKGDDDDDDDGQPRRRRREPDMAGGLASAMNAIEKAYGRPFGEMEPVPMMRFADGGDVIEDIDSTYTASGANFNPVSEEEQYHEGIMNQINKSVERDYDYFARIKLRENLKQGEIYDDAINLAEQEAFNMIKEKYGFNPQQFARGGEVEIEEETEDLGIRDLMRDQGVEYGEQVSNAQNDELLEKLFEEFLDLGFSPEDAAKKAREAFDDMSQGQGIKGTQVASGYKDDIEEMYEQYVFEMEEQGLEPMDFASYLRQAQSGMASGGRVGYKKGGAIAKLIDQGMDPTAALSLYEEWKDSGSNLSFQDYVGYGSIDNYAEGGIMNKNLLNTGMDKDMRGGGFIPEGTKEKADDVPARLSKNEFVMTADAVKAAGGGSVNQGAKRMYQLMNNLQGKA